MNMKVNLEASLDNLLYLDFMEKQQQKPAAEPNEDQNNLWYTQVSPQDDNEE